MHSIIKPFKSKKLSRGVITITVSLLLLGLSLIGALYTVKTKLLDIRIANSELRKNQAVISAEAGLQRGIAQLDVLPATTTSLVDEKVDENQYTVDFTPILDAFGVNVGHPNWDNDRIVTITSTGISDDSTGIKVMEQKVWIHPIARSVPDSAMTIDGTIEVGGNFRIGAAPNGGGLGVPLSVWSNNAAAVTGSGDTCGLEEFDNNECGTFSYSDKTNRGDDIFLDDLVSAGGTFPDDLFEHTFGVPRDEFQSIKDQATMVVANCNSLSAASTGLIWVTGDCDTPSVIGTTAAPAFIVLENANLKMNANDTVNGVIYTFDAPGNAGGGEVQMNGGAKLFGAFISDHSIGKVNGTYDLRYSPDVLENIVNGSNSVFMRVEIIPGSWKDF
ncbi:MAG: hypothetical protein ACSHW0_14650 [Thalassotalea sp.]